MWTALNRPRCQGGAPAARTNDLDDGAERFSASLVGVEVDEHRLCGVVQRLHSDVYGLGAGPSLRLPVIPSPPQEGAWSGACVTRGVSHNRDRAESRGSDNGAAARLRPSCSRRPLMVREVARRRLSADIVDRPEGGLQSARGRLVPGWVGRHGRSAHRASLFVGTTFDPAVVDCSMRIAPAIATSSPGSGRCCHSK